MKRFLAILMVLVFLCSCACAESFQDKCIYLMDMINAQLYYNEVSVSEFLFSGIYESVPEEAYVFFSDLTDIQAYLVTDTVGGEISRCNFSTADAGNLLLALNCCSFIPLITSTTPAEGDGGWVEMDENVIAAYESMIEWGDVIYVDALNAFANNEEYSAPELETDFFSVKLNIAPADGYSVATATYAFPSAK